MNVLKAKKGNCATEINNEDERKMVKYAFAIMTINQK